MVGVRHMFIEGGRLHEGELGSISSASSACPTHCVVHLDQDADQCMAATGCRSMSVCLRSGRPMRHIAGSGGVESREGTFPNRLAQLGQLKDHSQLAESI